MSKGRVFRGLLWLVTGRLASAVISIISTAVLARLLTPASFGIIAAAFVVLALANVIFDGAFGVNLVRKKELRPEDIATTLSVALLLGLTIALIIIVTAPLTERFFGFPHLREILIITSTTVPLKAIGSISCSQLQRDGKFKLLSITAVAGQIVGSLVVAVPMALAGWGPWSLVAAIVVSAFVESLLAITFVKMPLRLGWDREALHDIRATSFFSAANLMNWAANTSANAVIGHSLNAADLGFYSRSWKLLDLFVAATATPLSRALLPKFASLRGNAAGLQRAFLMTLQAVVPVYAVAAVLFVIHAPIIVHIALGRQWGAAVIVTQILFSVLIPRCVFKVSEVFAVATGQSRAAFFRQGVYCFLMVLGSIAGVRAGIIGVSVAVSAAISIFYFVSMRYAVFIGAIRGSAVVEIHVRGFLLAGCVALSDGLVLRGLGDLPFLAAHSLAGLAGIMTAVVVALLQPRFFFGAEIAGLGAKTLGRIFNRSLTIFNSGSLT